MKTHDEQIEEYKKEIQQVSNIIKDVVKKRDQLLEELFPEIYQIIFDKYPLLESFTWFQYTPYFNDGDPCYFRVNTDSESIRIRYDGEDYEWECPEELDSIKELISDSIGNMPESFLQEFFGDHVQVTIHRNGTIDKEDYDHN